MPRDMIERFNISVRMLFRLTSVAVVFVVASALFPANASESFAGPVFRKGLWRFIRTLDVGHAEARHRVEEREMTRCVDPTEAMKATFSSAPVGSCHSSKPERLANKYIFSNRCDYMGPVSTVITVQSEESYTEVNELTVGRLPRTDLVVAKRIGECHEARVELSGQSDQQIEY